MILKFLSRNCQPRPAENPIVLLSRQDIWNAPGLAGMVILLGSWQMVVGVCGVYHVDAMYVITARALAQGEGHRLINLPDCPLQTKYPILYPALLSIIWKLWSSFPQNMLAMQGRPPSRLPTCTWSVLAMLLGEQRWLPECSASLQSYFSILVL
jgi:hypothetical protein